MMESNNFTEGAKELLFRYIQELRANLFETGLTREEVEESVDDIYDHVVSNCTFRAGYGKPVTKDIVKKSLQKLGDPEVIQRTLGNELEFLEEKKKVVEIKEEDYVFIRASTLTKIYWLVQAYFIFIFSIYIYYTSFYQGYFSYSMEDDFFYKEVQRQFNKVLQGYFLLLLTKYLFIPAIIRFQDNAYLKKKLQFNTFHLFIVPYFILKHLFLLDGFFLLVVLLTFMGNFLAEDGRRWIQNKINSIKYTIFLISDRFT